MTSQKSTDSYQSVCDSAECFGPAEFVVHWPGQRVRLCAVCTARAGVVAQAMGFRLDFDLFVERGPAAAPGSASAATADDPSRTDSD